MNQINLNNLNTYIEQNIHIFHEKRIDRLNSLKLEKILKRKNPYLFKAKNILTSEELVKSLLDAHLSSQEETIFGEFLENLAIYVASEVYGGKKSKVEGIDLELTKGNTEFIISIKSGPNWGNSSQIKKMKDNFKKAQKIFYTNTNPKTQVSVRAINGCCYGKDNNPEKGDYRKLCGQRFWEFISNDPLLYLEIIEPLGHTAKNRNEKFNLEYAKVINLFSFDFMEKFCDNGIINWEKLTVFNSGIDS